MKNRTRVLQICRAALFAAMLAISALISIPTPIPITLQTFALFLLADCLPLSQACLSVVIYLCLGTVGLPVFAGFQSGIGTLLGPTGGFLVGSLPTVALYGYLASKTGSYMLRLFFAALSVMLLYLIGGLWYAYLFGTSGVLSVCVFPFILPDALKITAAVLLADRFKRIMK